MLSKINDRLYDNRRCKTFGAKKVIEGYVTPLGCKEAKLGNHSATVWRRSGIWGTLGAKKRIRVYLLHTFH